MAVASDVNSRDTSGEAILARLRAFEASMETLAAMAFVASQWSDGTQVKPWAKSLAKLAQKHADGGFEIWNGLQRYPATLLLYAFGLGAVLEENYEALHHLLSAKIAREDREDKRAVELVPVWALLPRADVMQHLPGRARQYTPLQNHLEEVFLVPVSLFLHLKIRVCACV